MDTFFRFVYLNVIYGGAVVLCMSLWYRIKYYKQPVYLYPITGALSKRKIFAVSYKKILSTIRFLILAGLLLLVARPQLVDQVSNVNVQGIDIMMVLDVSGSMQLFDDLQHRKSRIAVAKEEAIKFINKRESDPIGLVYFADQALTRCPVTLDKKMLESIITSTELGILNPQGTMLSKGLLMAINRLKKSDSKSKILAI